MFCVSRGYNPKKDISPVDQFGFVDITSALENGFVPSSAEPTPDSFNGIDEPDSILGRPSDIFEAYRMRDFIKNSSSGGSSGSESSDSVPDKD